MKDKEFLEFMTAGEAAPAALRECARKDICLSFHSRALMGRFVGFQVLGAIVSLAFCPQFSLGFFNAFDNHFTHQLHHIGPWACALFCASLFLTSGTVLAFLFMKGEELWWILRRKKLILVALPAVFWGLLMILNKSMKLPGEQAIYHVVWIITAISVQFLWLKLRNLFYTEGRLVKTSGL